MKNKILVPGLANPATNGFNMKETNFLGLPIFELAYTKGNKVHYGSSGNKQEYDLPDSFSLSTSVTSYSQTNATFLKTKADYTNSISANLMGSFSSPTFSGSMNSGLTFHGQLFKQNNTSYTLNWNLQQVYSVERNIDSMVLTDTFKTAVTKLSTTSSTSDFIAFFEKYGTHFLVKGGFGGYMTMATSIKDSLFETSSENTISAGVTAGYNGIVASGNISASVAVKSSTFLSDNTGSTSVYVAVNGGQKKDTLTEYFETTFDLPILLLMNPNMPFYSMTIANLVEQGGGSVDLKNKMELQIEAYIESGVGADGIIASGQKKNNAQIYQSAQDGFLMTRLISLTNGDRGYTQSFSQNSVTPTQLEGSASIHFYTDSDTWVPWASSTVPVKASNYYRATETSTSVSPYEKTTFVPLNISSLQPTQTLTTNKSQTPTNDGFIFCSIEARKNGDRGYVEVVQGNNKTAASIHYYESSDTWVPKNSFCFPVKKDVPYTITTKATSGEPFFTAYYNAMEGKLKFLDAIPLLEGTVTQAKNDGFLIGFLDAANNGDRSQLSVYANQDLDLLKTTMTNATSAKALTSIHYYMESDTWIPKNSVMVPIQKDEYYVCKIDNTAGRANHSIYFIPMVVKSV